MNIEIREDSSYTFTYTKIVNGLASNISTATIGLYDNSGVVQVASVAMNITDNVATYTVDLSGAPLGGSWDVNINYKAVMVIDGEYVVRLFDIVKYPFINEVTQLDLEAENSGALIGKGARVKGTATSGTISTLIDTRLVGIDTLAGGQVEIYTTSASGSSHLASITAHNTTTGEITFSPVRDTAVAVGADYNATCSFDGRITTAGEIVQEQLWMQDRRPYLIVDNSQVKRMIIYKFFERLFAQNRRAISEDNVDHVNYLYYRELYENIWKLPLKYDETEDGNIEDLEDRDNRISIRIVR